MRIEIPSMKHWLLPVGLAGLIGLLTACGEPQPLMDEETLADALESAETANAEQTPLRPQMREPLRTMTGGTVLLEAYEAEHARLAAAKQAVDRGMKRVGQAQPPLALRFDMAGFCGSGREGDMVTALNRLGTATAPLNARIDRCAAQCPDLSCESAVALLKAADAARLHSGSLGARLAGSGAEVTLQDTAAAFLATRAGLWPQAQTAVLEAIKTSDQAAAILAPHAEAYRTQAARADRLIWTGILQGPDAAELAQDLHNAARAMNQLISVLTGQSESAMPLAGRLIARIDIASQTYVARAETIEADDPSTIDLACTAALSDRALNLAASLKRATPRLTQCNQAAACGHAWAQDVDLIDASRLPVAEIVAKLRANIDALGQHSPAMTEASCR